MFPSTIIAIPSLFLFLTFIYILSTFLRSNNQTKHPQKRPPGPLALPVIGHFHLLGKLPHRSFQSLSQKYGPIMSLRLGHIPTIVVSSPEAAQLFLKTHDPIFANRPKIQATDFIFYGAKDMAFSEYGPYWRDMRKTCTLHLLSTSKVDMFGALRREEILLMVKSIERGARMGEVVDISEKVHGLLEDIVYKMVLGCSKDDEFDLKGLVSQALSLAGTFNLADYVPWLGAFDLQGLTRRLKETGKALDQVLEKILRQHEQASNINGAQHKDITDILLSLKDQPNMEEGEEEEEENEQQNYYNGNIGRDNIKATLLDLISGAYETSSVATEWALSELLRNPRVMKNLQDELQNVIGLNRMVEETDLPKLNYLNMVVKETLRLYPVAPFLPRASNEDAMVGGFHIEKNSRVFVNVWAIGRDPKIWSNHAGLFYPERFLDGRIDVLGQDFQLLPFGSGRRKCPGIQMGLTTFKLVLAQLMHCFNWELPGKMLPCDLDMTETFGLSIPRAKHLLGVPTLRICNL